MRRGRERKLRNAERRRARRKKPPALSGKRSARAN
jgi:hypothetical protein